MRADNSHHLVQAARRRAESTRSRATAAIEALYAAGEPITFETVAAKASISRAWLYSSKEHRAEITRLRERNPTRTPAAAVPSSQRASDASLLRRLEIAHDRIQRLSAENGDLRKKLERALGQNRVDRRQPTHAEESR